MIDSLVDKLFAEIGLPGAWKQTRLLSFFLFPFFSGSWSMLCQWWSDSKFAVTVVLHSWLLLVAGPF